MNHGRFPDIIGKKKQGLALSDEEIRDMIADYTAGKIPDYQMSAMLMAICFRGLTDRELTTMTMAMRDSGEVLDLSEIPGVKVDKHSTGGVGDKATLIVGPMVAASGVPVAKMSGRGLGFTGGTIDKLESIPGFCGEISNREFFRAVRKNGISIKGQTGNLVPADKKMYALRDVTGTVDSIPLIAASIMSKKLAAGGDKIVLDVTTGSGALIGDLEGSVELARRMVAIGNGAGRETVAMITSMEEPLGFAVGNRLEIREVVETLRDGGPEDVRIVCTALAGMMLSLGKGISYEEGKEQALEALVSGRAYERFLAMVETQGGDVSCIEYPERLAIAEISGELLAEEDGYLAGVDAGRIGAAAGILGAGRETKESEIDAGAGIVMKKKVGDRVRAGEPVAVLYTSQEERLERALAHLRGCCTVAGEKPEPLKLVVDIIR